MKNLPMRDRRAQRKSQSPYVKYGKVKYSYSPKLEEIISRCVNGVPGSADGLRAEHTRIWLSR